MVTIHSHTTSTTFETVIRSESGHEILSDEPIEAGGHNTGMAPDELIISALASCTSATVRMYAQHKGWELKEVKTSITMVSGERSFDFLSIERKIEFIGNLDEKQRERLLAVANKCPVHKLLTGGIEVKTSL